MFELRQILIHAHEHAHEWKCQNSKSSGCQNSKEECQCSINLNEILIHDYAII